MAVDELATEGLHARKRLRGVSVLTPSRHIGLSLMLHDQARIEAGTKVRMLCP